jgi:hypothetical protein
MKTTDALAFLMDKPSPATDPWAEEREAIAANAKLIETTTESRASAIRDMRRLLRGKTKAL